MRTESDAQRGDLFAHPRRVALEARAVEDQRWRRKIEDGEGPLARANDPWVSPGHPAGGDGAQGRDRTTDTVIFSHVLYQLSYLGSWKRAGGPFKRGAP